jgi:hypothetical protein
LEVDFTFDTPKDEMGRSLGLFHIYAKTYVDIEGQLKGFYVSQQLSIHLEDYPGRNVLVFTIERLMWALESGIKEAQRKAVAEALEKACLRANARYRALHHYGAKIKAGWLRDVRESCVVWIPLFRCESMHCSGGFGTDGLRATHPDQVKAVESQATRYCTCGHMHALTLEDTPEIKALTELELCAELG